MFAGHRLATALMHTLTQCCCRFADLAERERSLSRIRNFRTPMRRPHRDRHKRRPVRVKRDSSPRRAGLWNSSDCWRSHSLARASLPLFRSRVWRFLARFGRPGLASRCARGGAALSVVRLAAFQQQPELPSVPRSGSAHRRTHCSWTPGRNAWEVPTGFEHVPFLCTLFKAVPRPRLLVAHAWPTRVQRA